MNQYRRRLPHFYPAGKPLFLTWHLEGSLPQGLYPPPGKPSAGQAFVWIDRQLDTARGGPRHLERAEVARVVLASIHKGVELRHYELHAFVLMPNHVHMLITPRVPPSRLLKALKGASARYANRILGRTGQRFWQSESYDRWVRDEAEFERIRVYIENNPVKAGLAVSADSYPWSSAAKGQPRPQEPT